LTTDPKPPNTYDVFVKRFPRLGQAWELVAQAGKEGPLDERTTRLIKLAVAIGAMREGAVHAGIRKALAMGITPGEIEQVIAVSASTLGFPSVVAVFSWIEEALAKGKA
jgi:alkylhydroperoxidase/carboxymuconolactone decarboxylase family protein YurZ